MKYYITQKGYYYKIYANGKRKRISKKSAIKNMKGGNLITIPKDKILFLGTKEYTNSCPNKFIYKGQESNNTNTNNVLKGIIYTTNDESTAEGYATCYGTVSGWVKKYIVNTEFNLPDISEEQLHYNANDVKKTYCENNGYYLKWQNEPLIEEIVICNPEKYLTYLGSKKCEGSGVFSNYMCE